MPLDERDPVFGPDQIESMHKAFRVVCTRMDLKGTKSAPIIELVAIKIVELARAGEFNAEKLIEGVLSELGAIGNPARSRSLN
jgi:hypothetical protein